jgi:hypothetical protein
MKDEPAIDGNGDAGYSWLRRPETHEPVVTTIAAPESFHTQAPVGTEQSFPKTKLKTVGKAQSRSAHRRTNPPPNEHRVDAR